MLQAMGEREVDLLLLGREGNARYVSGARRLWLGGTRAFAPGCAVVRETGAVHLLSVTDDGIPSEIPPERLYPISWNPMNLLAPVVNAPGVAGARRVGVDGITPLFEQLLAGMLPGAELVDGESLLRSVRRRKSATDIAAIHTAARVADDALGAVIDALAPGVREVDLVGVFDERMASHGVTTPAYDAVVSVAEEGAVGAWSTDRVIDDGDLVTISAGALADGWEASLARTWPCGEVTREHRSALEAWSTAWSELVDRCRAGARVGDLRDEGIELHGVGASYEVLADDEVLEPDMVVALELRHAGILGGDTLLVTDVGSEPLTRASYFAID
ncbi:MAG TPA: M24 family metallopeptidase [Acidimicrobiia bacterium]|nr:M24 family metallopeptidase [Acidimicrobiia bacterium]